MAMITAGITVIAQTHAGPIWIIATEAAARPKQMPSIMKLTQIIIMIFPYYLIIKCASSLATMEKKIKKFMIIKVVMINAVV